MKITKRILTTLLLMTLLFCMSLSASAAKPKLNKSKATVLCGKSVKLTANQKVTWTSSNESIATVKNGKVTGKNYGTVNITATNKKGEKRTCKVTVSKYTVKSTGNRKYPTQVTVHISGKTYKTYKNYSQTGFSSAYINQRGCSHSALCTALSAYGKSYTPLDTHNGSVKVKASERYALKKLGKTPRVTGQSMSVYSISHMMNNAGVKCHPVYKFTKTGAIKEITDNLNTGRPVLIMCHRKKVNGVKLANSYHFIVLVGIDQNGYAIALNPAGGTVNRSHCTGNFKLTVKQLVKNHMWSCTGNGYKNFYFNGSKNYGGYIVVDK